MKYQVGDKVRYGSGEWFFYGTVTAVIENSINPCYRLSIDRMVKKNCRFSITQFEFELEADIDEREQDSLKWENLKIEYLKKYFVTPTTEKISDVITPEPVIVQKPITEPVSIPVFAPVPESVLVPEQKEPEQKEPEPEQKQGRKPRQERKPRQGRKPKQEQKAEQEPIPASVPEPEKVATSRIQKEVKQKRKRGEAWESNFEAFRNGDRSKKTHAWISINRKLYKSGDLSEDKFEKLMEINFPFEVQKLKRGPKAGWGKQLELWKKGERNSLQEWRQRSVRQYVAGKLSKDKIEKLKEVGILK